MMAAMNPIGFFESNGTLWISSKRNQNLSTYHIGNGSSNESLPKFQLDDRFPQTKPLTLDIAVLQKNFWIFNLIWTRRICSLNCSNEMLNVINAFEKSAHSKYHRYKTCCNHDDCDYHTNAFDVLIKAFGIANQIQNTCDKQIANQNRPDQ